MHLHLSVPHPSLPHPSVPHRRLPAPHLPALLLSVLYAAAVAVALTAPGEHAPAGVVVLIGLVARWALRHRHRSAARSQDVVPAAAPASASSA